MIDPNQRPKRVTLAVAYGLVARDNASSICPSWMKMKRLFLVFTSQDRRQFMDVAPAILTVAGTCVTRKDIYSITSNINK